jgi:hypothetical protein
VKGLASKHRSQTKAAPLVFAMTIDAEQQQVTTKMEGGTYDERGMTEHTSK